MSGGHYCDKCARAYYHCICQTGPGIVPLDNPPAAPAHRADFEAWADRTQPAYWRTTAWAREAWGIWQASRAATTPT